MIIRCDDTDCLLHRAVLLGAIMFFTMVSLGGWARSASAQTPTKSSEVMVHASADESSPLIETVRDGVALAPLGEMTGGGGEKWFMVKTPSGNVGWIKAGDHAQARRVDDHFRSLPKDIGMVVPMSGAPDPEVKVSTSGAVTVPVKIRGNLVVVPVTFFNGNSSVTGNLVMDTGASQTTVSKRIARDLRLYSVGSSRSAGIGGVVPTEISMVEGIKVGSIGLKNMRVSILDFSSDPSFEGLLGFDFLSRFQISVDTAKQVLIL